MKKFVSFVVHFVVGLVMVLCGPGCVMPPEYHGPSPHVHQDVHTIIHTDHCGCCHPQFQVEVWGVNADGWYHYDTSTQPGSPLPGWSDNRRGGARDQSRAPTHQHNSRGNSKPGAPLPGWKDNRR
jgi:hypothetical protein